MKSTFTNEIIERIVGEIASAARGIVQRELDALHEEELVAKLRGDAALGPKTKVVEYLAQTTKGLSRETLDEDEHNVWVTVESEYLRKNLGIAPLVMKDVRAQLEDEGDIVVDRKSHRPIVIRHIQSY